MLQQLTGNLIVFFITYIATMLIRQFLYAKNDMQIYKFKKDPYLYIFCILATSFFSVFFITPDFSDSVASEPMSAFFLFTNFILAALIYVCFLLEIKKPLIAMIFISSLLSSFLFINPDSLPSISFIPWQLEVLGIGLLMGAVTFSAKLLIGLPGIFSLIMSMSSLGLIIISAAGGLPLIISLMATAFFGIFASTFQFNRQEVTLPINEGAMMSATFLFCTLLLQGINELAAPSMFILIIYFIVELLWSLFKQYILSNKEPDLYFNTIYWSAFQKGLFVSSVHTILFKLCIVNIILATFELHMPNAVSLPLLAFVINCWLLSKMYNIDKIEPSQPLPKKTKTATRQTKKRSSKG